LMPPALGAAVSGRVANRDGALTERRQSADTLDDTQSSPVSQHRHPRSARPPPTPSQHTPPAWRRDDPTLRESAAEESSLQRDSRCAKDAAMPGTPIPRDPCRERRVLQEGAVQRNALGCLSCIPRSHSPRTTPADSAGSITAAMPESNSSDACATSTGGN
jgi:hypothetical protein